MLFFLRKYLTTLKKKLHRSCPAKFKIHVYHSFIIPQLPLDKCCLWETGLHFFHVAFKCYENILKTAINDYHHICSSITKYYEIFLTLFFLLFLLYLWFNSFMTEAVIM